MGRAEKRRSLRAAKASLPPEWKRQMKQAAGRRRGFMDRALHHDEPDVEDGPPKPSLTGTPPPPVMSVEDMDKREAEIVKEIPESIRNEPETALMLTRLRSTWMNPVPKEVAELWWNEWKAFLDTRPEARRIAAAKAGLFVPGVSDGAGAPSGLILPGGTP